MAIALIRTSMHKGHTIWHWSLRGVSGKVLKGTRFYSVVKRGKRFRFDDLHNARKFIDKFAIVKRKK